MASARGIWGSLTGSSGTHDLLESSSPFNEIPAGGGRMTCTHSVAWDTPPPNPQIQPLSSCSWDETPKLHHKHRILKMGRRLRRLRERMKERREKLFDNKARLLCCSAGSLGFGSRISQSWVQMAARAHRNENPYISDRG